MTRFSGFSPLSLHAAKFPCCFVQAPKKKTTTTKAKPAVKKTTATKKKAPAKPKAEGVTSTEDAKAAAKPKAKKPASAKPKSGVAADPKGNAKKGAATNKVRDQPGCTLSFCTPT